MEAEFNVTVIGGVVIPNHLAAFEFMKESDRIHVSFKYHIPILSLGVSLGYSLLRHIGAIKYKIGPDGIFYIIGKRFAGACLITALVHIGGAFKLGDIKIQLV
jgi:hypothetical protein